MAQPKKIKPIDAVKEMKRRGASESDIYRVTGFKQDNEGNWSKQEASLPSLADYARALNGVSREQIKANAEIFKGQSDLFKDMQKENLKSREDMGAHLMQMAESLSKSSQESSEGFQRVSTNIDSVLNIALKLTSAIAESNQQMIDSLSNIEVSINSESGNDELIKVIKEARTVKGVEFKRDKNGFLTGAEFVY